MPCLEVLFVPIALKSEIVISANNAMKQRQAFRTSEHVSLLHLGLVWEVV